MRQFEKCYIVKISQGASWYHEIVLGKKTVGIGAPVPTFCEKKIIKNIFLKFA